MVLRFSLVCFLFITCASSNLAAQANNDRKAESDQVWQVSDDAASLGFSPRQLNQIHNQMKGLVRGESVVGHSALLLKDGKEVFYGHWGLGNREKKTPLKRDTIYRIYSMTKPITSVAAMQLVEQGKLKLDVPASEYLPEFKNLKVLVRKKEIEPRREMTVRDLMRHTSGLTYGFYGKTEVDKQYRKSLVMIGDHSMAESVTKLSKIPLLHHPGTRFHYGVSTDVLGRIVEVVSEMPLDKYMAENIFQPLEMKDTFFTVPAAKQNRLAELYLSAGRKKLVPANTAASLQYVYAENKMFSGGGGLCSTIDDYARFSEMLIGNGQLDGKRILNPDSIKEMWTNQLATIVRKSRTFQFGLGFEIGSRGEVGWSGAAGTRFWTDPHRKLTILYMVQIQPYGSRQYGNFVKDTVYDALGR